MAHDVEVKLTAGDFVKIEFGAQDARTIEKRPREDFAQRVDDATTAARHDRLRIVALGCGIIIWVVAATRELVARENEAPALQSDVPHSRLPCVAVVGRRSTIKLDPPRVKVHPQKRHVVLPADCSPEPADRSFDHFHCRAVSEAPDESLGCGRHELAVLTQERPVGTKKEHRAVERSAVAFDNSDDEVDMSPSRDRTKRFGRRAGHIDRAFPVAAKQLAAFGRA